MNTVKEFNEEVKEICKYFNLSPIGTIDNKNCLQTIWGDYHFYFSDKSIFGKFEKLRVNLLPNKYEYVNGKLYQVKHFPNIYTGKFNFHFEDVYDFIDTLDRILIINEEE